jgi:hypothetical protein
MSTLVKFAGLFAGRNVAYFNGFGAEWRRCTLLTFRDHLWSGSVGFGTYPVSTNGLCRWGCIDLDGNNYTFRSACDVTDVWEYYGITAWVERSRSKGWHIWTFADSWIPAYLMRNAGLHVARIAELPENTEVNPKNIATWQTKRGLVNTVRMPYPGNRAEGRQVVVDRASALPLSLEDFTEAAHQAKAPRERFATVAALWQAAEDRRTLEGRWRSLLAGSGQTFSGNTLNQDAYKVLRGERRIEDNRDNQLWTLANLMHGLGMSREEALDKMNQVWHNQVNYSSPDWYPLEQALGKVERVYAC